MVMFRKVTETCWLVLSDEYFVNGEAFQNGLCEVMFR